MSALAQRSLQELRPSSLLVGFVEHRPWNVASPCSARRTVGGPRPVSLRVETKRSGLTLRNLLIRMGLWRAVPGGAARAGHPPFISQPGRPMGPNYYRLEKWEGVRGNPSQAGATP